MAKKTEDIFIRFDRIHERDGHTDRQTPHDGIGRAYAIASRGKKTQARTKRLVNSTNIRLKIK